ncbi:elongation factor G-like protein EF-G2, partial [Nocardia puris]|nr:elongation factor G-like protein EF-G2 [Nocardia puris]
LHADDTVHICGHGLADRGHPDHDLDERVGALTAPFGKQQRPLPQAIAGDIACVTKLGHAETGDTLSGTGAPLLIEPWPMPDPLLPIAVRAHSKADEDKLSTGLTRLAAEDPALRLEHNADTGQLVL